MLSFYLSQVPLGPTCPPQQVWVVPESAPKPRVSYDPAASQDKPELGMSSVTAGNCQHPLLASASEVTPGDLGASSWKSVVLACPHLQLPPPTQVGLSRDPHPASHWGFLEVAWGMKNYIEAAPHRPTGPRFTSPGHCQLQAGEAQVSGN